jgi:hypothetical protein
MVSVALLPTMNGSVGYHSTLKRVRTLETADLSARARLYLIARLN